MANLAKETTNVAYRCIRCKGPVGLNYDHTGPRCAADSRADECSGTFFHADIRSRCTHASRNTAHALVELSPAS